MDSSGLNCFLTEDIVAFNGDMIPTKELAVRLERVLKNKTEEKDKIVVVNSADDTPYFHWIYVTGVIEQAGGIITIQTEEERTVTVP